MKPHFKLFVLLTCTLLCSASIVPRYTWSNDITSYLHSLGIPLVARQDASCLSEEECGEGMLCVQLNGEPFCKTECQGFCIPEEARGFICNCELPCSEGSCTDPSPGAEQSDNGLCSPEKDMELFKCTGKEQEDGNDGETVNDEEKEETMGGKDQDKNTDQLDGPNPEEDESDKTQSDDDDTEKDTEDKRDASDSMAGQDGDGKKEEDDDGEEEGQEGEENISEDHEEEEENISGEPGRGSGANPEQAGSDANPTVTETPEGMIPSPETQPSDDIEEQSSAVCISTEHLSHLPSSSLVFRKDVLAPVLCDTSGSCATAGHMVIFRGRGMMMRRYCDEVGCVKRVMRVNSPVYKSGMRVESRSIDLSFAALAARFETVAEEVVLAAAVRVGL